MSFVYPKKRFLMHGAIVIQVPGKVLSNDGTTVAVKMYDSSTPLKMTVAEFEERFETKEPSAAVIADFDVVPISKSAIVKAAGTFPESVATLMEKMFDKCHMDAYMAAGNTKNCTIEKYDKLMAARAAPSSTPPTLESYAPQCNRRPRNSAVIPPDFDDALFQKDPLPIGIDAHEFATKAEQNAICKTLITQLYGFEGAPPMTDALQKLLGLAEKPVAGTHTCKYCCKPMEIAKVAQKYKAKVHYLNLCHDDPKRGTRADNLYWGHTPCNREQGGCSSFERVVQGLQLGARTTFTAEEKAELGPLIAALQAALQA
jgi:hypothetical protein